MENLTNEGYEMRDTFMDKVFNRDIYILGKEGNLEKPLHFPNYSDDPYMDYSIESLISQTDGGIIIGGEGLEDILGEYLQEYSNLLMNFVHFHDKYPVYTRLNLNDMEGKDMSRYTNLFVTSHYLPSLNSEFERAWYESLESAKASVIGYPGYIGNWSIDEWRESIGVLDRTFPLQDIRNNK